MRRLFVRREGRRLLLLSQSAELRIMFVGVKFARIEKNLQHRNQRSVPFELF